MKLLIQNDRVVGTATTAYIGPDQYIDAPPDFDISRMDEYRIIDGRVVLMANRKLTRLAFRRRFTQAERESIYTAASTQPAIQVFLDDIMVAEFVDLDDPGLISGVQQLEAVGLLASGRALEVLDSTA